MKEVNTVKKWICFLNSRPYDPSKGQPIGELQGVATCRWVEEKEYELLFWSKDHRYGSSLKKILTKPGKFLKVFKPCGCHYMCQCDWDLVGQKVRLLTHAGPRQGGSRLPRRHCAE